MITRGEVKLIVPYKLPVIGGNEVVGKIEAVGANVTQFSVGERVFPAYHSIVSVLLHNMLLLMPMRSLKFRVFK